MGSLQRVLVLDELADPVNNLDLVHALSFQVGQPLSTPSTFTYGRAHRSRIAIRSAGTSTPLASACSTMREPAVTWEANPGLRRHRRQLDLQTTDEAVTRGCARIDGQDHLTDVGWTTLVAGEPRRLEREARSGHTPSHDVHQQRERRALVTRCRGHRAGQSGRRIRCRMSGCVERPPQRDVLARLRGRVHLDPCHRRRGEVGHDRCAVHARGAAHAIGLVPKNGTAPPAGAIADEELANITLTSPSSARRSTNQPSTPAEYEWEMLRMPMPHALGGFDQRRAADLERRMGEAVTSVDQHRRRPRGGHDRHRIADHLPACDVFAVGGQVREADCPDAVGLGIADAASRRLGLRRTGTGGRQHAITERLDLIERQGGRGGFRQRRTRFANSASGQTNDARKPRTGRLGYGRHDECSNDRTDHRVVGPPPLRRRRLPHVRRPDHHRHGRARRASRRRRRHGRHR